MKDDLKLIQVVDILYESKQVSLFGFAFNVLFQTFHIKILLGRETLSECQLEGYLLNRILF